MPSSSPYPYPYPYPEAPQPETLFPAVGSEPLAPLGQLLHALSVGSLHALLGVGLGLCAADAMRRSHLHHAWAACALALIVLGRGLFPGSALTLGVAALSATLRTRRWHRDDLLAGADLAEIARQRLRPRDGLRAAVRGLGRVAIGLCTRHAPSHRALLRCAGALDTLGLHGVSRALGPHDALAALASHRSVAALGLDAVHGRSLRDERWFRGGELTVGEDRRGRPVAIPLGGAGEGTHTLVLGATGSGKTVTQTWIAVRAIEHGMAALVVDPKGDRRMRGELLLAARAAGRPFVEWTPDGPSVYNPFARGSRSEIADKLLAGERFTEPHYLRQAQRYLGQAIGALQRAGVEVSLAEVARHLDPAHLELLARRLPEADARELYAYLESLTPRQRSELGGVRDRLAVMAESDVGPWLDPRTPDAARFDVLAALRARAVVYVCMQADRLPLLAQMLGAAVVQDLQSACATLHTAPLPSLVVLDEFSALAAEHVASLFGRARSAGMSLVLGTQELSDLRLPGQRTLLETVLGNVSAVIAHRQAVPDSADLLARLSGVRGAWSSSLSSDGRSTRRRELVPRIAASDISGLARGRAMVAVIAQSGRVQLARMYSPRRAA